MTTDANAVAESFFATLRVDLVRRQAWSTQAAARVAIFESSNGWSNRRRRHSTQGDATSAGYEAVAREPAIA